MIGQFDHWKTPFAKDLALPSLNSLTDLSLKLTDGTGSGSDVMRIRIRRASNGQLVGAPQVEAGAGTRGRAPMQGAAA
jgi:phenylacetyl-CoA:acceptor oxidoreductase